MSRQGERAGPLHAGRFDEQHLSADRRPRHADGDARILRALLDLLVEKTRRAEQLDDSVARELDRLLMSLGAASRDLPYQRRDLALEIADTRLARVAANH